MSTTVGEFAKAVRAGVSPREVISIACKIATELLDENTAIKEKARRLDHGLTYACAMLMRVIEKHDRDETLDLNKFELAIMRDWVERLASIGGVAKTAEDIRALEIASDIRAGRLNMQLPVP